MNNMTTTPTPGDLLVDVASTKSAILATYDNSNRITITRNVVANTIDFDQVELDGVNIATRIASIATQPGVGDSNVKEAHITDGSILTDKFALVSVANGGTGLSNVGAGELVFATASGSELSSSPGLTSTDYGVVMGDQWKLRLKDGADIAEFSESNGSLVVDHAGSITNLSEASKGSPPTIDSLVLNTNVLSYTLADPDGDLRSLHLVWYYSTQTPAPSPTDVFFFATGEGSSSYTIPAGSNEVDLFEAINTGSSTFSGTHTNPDLAGKVVYAVAEDGPGNLSGVSRAL